MDILHRRELAAAEVSAREELRGRLIAEHLRTNSGVERGVELGLVDEIIDPAQTRRKLGEALASAPAGRGHHGNIPL